MSTKPKKSYVKMTAQELAEATKSFDAAPLPDEVGEPLTPAEREEWEKTRRGRGRPRKGRGAVNVLISVERGLLERADAFAKERKMGRSQLAAIGLETVMALSAVESLQARSHAARDNADTDGVNRNQARHGSKRPPRPVSVHA